MRAAAVAASSASTSTSTLWEREQHERAELEELEEREEHERAGREREKCEWECCGGRGAHARVGGGARAHRGAQPPLERPARLRGQGAPCDCERDGARRGARACCWRRRRRGELSYCCLIYFCIPHLHCSHFAYTLYVVFYLPYSTPLPYLLAPYPATCCLFQVCPVQCTLFFASFVVFRIQRFELSIPRALTGRVAEGVTPHDAARRVTRSPSLSVSYRNHHHHHHQPTNHDVEPGLPPGARFTGFSLARTSSSVPPFPQPRADPDRA